jgi:hypothetical protein
MFVIQLQKQPTSTFQIVMVTDGIMTYIMMNYQKLSWTSSTTDGGNSQGFGGYQAMVSVPASQ